MGIQNITGFKVPAEDKAHKEIGVQYFVVGGKLSIIDGDGNLQVIPYLADLSPIQGGPGNDHRHEYGKNVIHLGNWEFQVPNTFASLQVFYRGTRFFSPDDFVITGINTFKIVHSQVILTNNYGKVKVDYTVTI